MLPTRITKFHHNSIRWGRRIRWQIKRRSGIIRDDAFYPVTLFAEDDTDTTESGSTEYATDVMFDMKTMNVVPATVCYTYLEPSYT